MTQEPIKFAMNIRMPDTTDQQKGVNFKSRRFYTKDDVKAIHTLLKWHMKPYKPKEPLDGPLSVVIRIYYAYNKLTPKRIVKQGLIYPKDTRPDWDNLGKGICDVLADMKFIANDARIYSGTVEKWFAPADKITIEIIPYENL